MTKLFLGAATYFGIQFALGWAFQKTQHGIMAQDKSGKDIIVPANTDEIPPYALRPHHLNEGASYSRVPEKIAPIWPADSYVDIVVTLSPSFMPTALSKTPEELVIMRESHIKMGNYSEKRTATGEFAVPTSVQNNGTLWGHFFLALSGAQLDPTEPGYDVAHAYHFAYPLTQYIPKKKVHKTRNLLDDMPAPVEEDDHKGPPVIANYYHPNVSISLVSDTGVMAYPQLHPATRQFLNLEPTGARDGTGQNSWYYPFLFVNTFWQLRSHMTLLNDTVKTLPVRIDLNNMRGIQFKTVAAIELASREAARQAAFGNSLPGGGDGTEMEMVKEIFFDTNPYLLGVTVVVSIAHVILETLAFGSDIAHYRKKKDNVGISVRSILANVFMQAVIFLYLLDNSQNTSWMILGSQVVGILIELWKITTVVNIKFGPLPPGSWLPYGMYLEDKQTLTETEEKTKEYDQIAFKYMYWAGVPLLIAYAIYSLMYNTHKSWYSYIITTLVGSVYAYGFLLMVPSLYINYRLKSVAHMPAKAMLYKFLNTFIDDLFAFTIKMPLLHRLATFRDDIIFFIYMYQRWMYRIDYTRVNEFGQSGEEGEAATGEAATGEVATGEAAEKKDKDVTAAAVAVAVESAAHAEATGAEKKKAAKKRK
jgi:hypothetical protein